MGDVRGLPKSPRSDDELCLQLQTAVDGIETCHDDEKVRVCYLYRNVYDTRLKRDIHRVCDDEEEKEKMGLDESVAKASMSVPILFENAVRCWPSTRWSPQFLNDKNPEIYDKLDKNVSVSFSNLFGVIPENLVKSQVRWHNFGFKPAKMKDQILIYGRSRSEKFGSEDLGMVAGSSHLVAQLHGTTEWRLSLKSNISSEECVKVTVRTYQGDLLYIPSAATAIASTCMEEGSLFSMRPLRLFLFDTTTADMIAKVEKAKKLAAEREDYVEAKRLKVKIDRMKEVGVEIGSLEAQKTKAVDREDYDIAMQLKEKIDVLRIRLSDPLPNNKSKEPRDSGKKGIPIRETPATPRRSEAEMESSKEKEKAKQSHTQEPQQQQKKTEVKKEP